MAAITEFEKKLKKLRKSIILENHNNKNLYPYLFSALSLVPLLGPVIIHLLFYYRLNKRYKNQYDDHKYKVFYDASFREYDSDEFSEYKLKKTVDSRKEYLKKIYTKLERSNFLSKVTLFQTLALYNIFFFLGIILTYFIFGYFGFSAMLAINPEMIVAPIFCGLLLVVSPIVSFFQGQKIGQMSDFIEAQIKAKSISEQLKIMIEQCGQDHNKLQRLEELIDHLTKHYEDDFKTQESYKSYEIFRYRDVPATRQVKLLGESCDVKETGTYNKDIFPQSSLISESKVMEIFNKQIQTGMER